MDALCKRLWYMSCSLLNSFIREIKSHYDSRLQNQEGYRMVFVSICELARRAFRSNELKLRHLFFSHFKATKCLKEFKGKRMRLGSVLVGDSDFFLCPMLVSCWSTHLSHFRYRGQNSPSLLTNQVMLFYPSLKSNAILDNTALNVYFANSTPYRRSSVRKKCFWRAL